MLFSYINPSPSDLFEYTNLFILPPYWRGMDAYTGLVERIAHASTLSVEEVERKVEGKRAKLSGLVSKEGAAHIVAAELGINFDREKFTIRELGSLKRANLIAQLLEVGPIRSFSKQGREGKVGNALLGDTTGTIRAVFWDTNHIGLLEQGTLQKGDVVEIMNATLRNGEVHLSSFADIKKSSERLLGPVVHVSEVLPGTFALARPGTKGVFRAFVVQVFEPRYFEVCKECGKRMGEGGCAIHGAGGSEKRALVTLVLDDGTETIRAVLFMQQLLALGFSTEELFSLELFGVKRASLVGEEFLVTGSVRQNALYSTVELIVERMTPVSADTLLTSLQA
jgi:hypothetical protein